MILNYKIYSDICRTASVRDLNIVPYDLINKNMHDFRDANGLPLV